MTYDRDNPSPRYRELLDLYRRMHREGERFLQVPAEKTFPGSSLIREAPHIRDLVARTGSSRLVDYGSGKGMQYRARPVEVGGKQWDCIADYWDVDFVRCYDPAYPPFQDFPDESYDGAICTDVLEHCPEEDVPWIVAEIFGLASRFVYASIAGYPAMKRLPSGENAHCTVKPLAWWQEHFRANADRAAGLLWQVRYYGPAAPGGQPVPVTAGNA